MSSATRDPKTPAAAQSEALERAYRALDQFVEISVAASRDAQAAAARWNQLGTYAGSRKPRSSWSSGNAHVVLHFSDVAPACYR